MNITLKEPRAFCTRHVLLIILGVSYKESLLFVLSGHVDIQGEYLISAQ